MGPSPNYMQQPSNSFEWRKPPSGWLPVWKSATRSPTPSRRAFDETRAKVQRSNPRSPSLSRSSRQNRDRAIMTMTPEVKEVIKKEIVDENEQDIEDEVKDEFVKTLTNYSDNEDETKITDKSGGDKDEEIDYTTSQLYDDKTEVPTTSSSHSSELAAKFLNFSDIPHTDAKIISLMDVHVHHKVSSKQTPTLLTILVLVIIDSSPVYSTAILQSLPSFTPSPQQSTSTPSLTTEATIPPSTLPDFASVFQFNNIVTSLEKEVAKLKKDPLHTKVTTLVDDHLDARLGATRNEFMNFLLALLTARIIERVKNQMPQILPEKVSNFAPPPSLVI
ncbi:hypothetical protein Tco_1140057 [Tanacetum coccineum]